MTPTLKKILIVDDEPDIRMVARTALESLGGFEVKEMVSGVAALEHLQTTVPDAILLDFMMPEMDGPETLAAIRRLPEASAVPVILLTARAKATQLEEYAQLDIAGTIPKPFDPMTLSDQVRELCAAWRARN